MSRVPRSQEHLKTGFTSEASAAARYRAYSEAARREGLPKLAGSWLELAEAKDQLAIRQLAAAGKVHGPERALADEIAEDRFENDVLYPKIIRDLGADEAVEVFREVVAAQEAHIERLTDLKLRLQAATGDID